MTTITQIAVAVVAIILTSMVALVVRYWFYVQRFLRLLSLANLVSNHNKKFKGKTFSFVDFYEKKVDEDPEAVQLIMAESGESRSRRAIDNLANQIAAWALSKGLVQQDSIALMLQNQLDYPSIWMGVSKVGVRTALLNTNIFGLPFQHSVRTALQNSTSKILIIDIELRDVLSADLAKLRGEGVEVFFWGDNEVCVNFSDIAHMPTTRPSETLRSQVIENMPLIFIFTSGTTGLPKACKISQTRYFAGSHYYSIASALSSKDVIYCSLPLYHSAGGLLGLGAALSSGAGFVMRKRFSVSAFTADCLQYHVTSVQYIGELCRYLVGAPENPLDAKLRIQSAFGNGLRAECWQAFKQRYHIQEIFEFYAATEGNISLINCFDKMGALGFVPRIFDLVFFPARLVKVQPDDSSTPLRDAHGRCQLCAINEPGLLISEISPDRIFDGYTDAKATEAKVLRNVFKAGDAFFNTGDLLSRDPLGFFYWCDRVGDTFRWKGENVSTTEVSHALSSCALVGDVVVYGVTVPRSDGRAGMAAIVSQRHPISNQDLQQVADAVHANLPTYARPLFVRVKAVGEMLPVTSTHKYLKADLISEGFDPARVQDDHLYFLDIKQRAYLPLSNEVFQAIEDGSLRF
jgi:acyl-CoA synthetase (AMP-forming)/AMP-acid ligase II